MPEELPDHVLGPALNQIFVAEVEAVLQVQQAGHQADGQARPSSRADSATELDVIGAQQIGPALALGRPGLTGQLRRHRSVDGAPPQPRGLHRQRVLQVDHRVQSGAKEVVCGYRQQSSTPQELLYIGLDHWGSDHREYPESHLKTTSYEYCRANYVTDAGKYSLHWNLVRAEDAQRPLGLALHRERAQAANG